MGKVLRGGLFQRTYGTLDAEARLGVLTTIGLKTVQRIGHRHKVPELRTLTDLAAGFDAVDAWVRADDAVGGLFALGDLFDGLIRALIERARELLGENADEPTTEHLKVMSEALSAERSPAEAKLLLAAVVELDFTATPQVVELSATDERFALPIEA